MTPLHDVVVIGAGPAGSATALRLAESGHDVVLVDRSLEPRRAITCTGIIGRESFDAVGLPRSAIIDIIHQARFVSPGGVRVRFAPQHPLAYVVDRSAFDSALADRARGAGAAVLYGAGVTGVEPGTDRVTLPLAGPGGRTLTARAVVIATGHQRRLHAAAGLGTPPSLIMGVGADLPFADLDAAEVFFGNHVAPGFFGWAVPFGPGAARLGVLSSSGGRDRFESFLRTDAIRSRLNVSLDPAGWRLIRSRIRSRKIVQGAVTPSFSRRVLAVGEAAGQIKTTTSGGIYYGLVGAELAARVLSRALRTDRLEARHLAAYERRWLRELGGEIRSGLELQDVARGMDDDAIDELFVALDNGLGTSVRHMIRFDWHRPALRALLARRHQWPLMGAAVG